MIKEKPEIFKKIKNSNLEKQSVYEAKEKYCLVFVNKKLYEKLFKKPFNKDSKEELERLFSLTLEKDMSNGELIGEGYADRQFDESGIALSGNLGSGRAFFYGKNFNIKGEKTSLAIAKDKYYSDGKFSLQAALKESVLANLIKEDFDIDGFQTFAVFDKKKKYSFRQQYQDENDEIIDEYLELNEAIEVRYYEKDNIYRLSNFMADKKVFSEKDIKRICRKIGKMEANKFLDRFLHGSWSAGNLTTGCNMLDFDTSCFLEGRFPQYSNTNKYKASYFGNEILGQKMLVKNLLEYNKKCGGYCEFSEAENLIDKSYKKYLIQGFCELLGLDYGEHYKPNKEIIDKIFDKFFTLSRKFLPNYLELSVYSEFVNKSYIYNFSNFFQKFLYEIGQNKDVFKALSILINPTEKFEYEKIGNIKNIVDNAFKDDIVFDSANFIVETIKETSIVTERLQKLYSSFTEIELKKIAFKCFVVNYNRENLYANSFLFDKICSCYESGDFSANDVDKIVCDLIKTNKRHYDFKNVESFDLGYNLSGNYAYYFKLFSDSVKIVFCPFDKLNTSFAKVFVNGKDYMLSHSEEGLISENIPFEKPTDIENFDIKFKVNGKRVELVKFV